ncbi:hypothetical protein V491_08710 [Pseudogymnoascus sp. VKM F-3775]|nr:hypothetical protein V491_08710 [Pseudogymnoascus sp. VKM F-3775]
MDGQKFYDLPNQWNRAAGDTTNRYFRLNTQLQGKTPALDDVSTMSLLKYETRKQHSKSKTLDELADSLISTLFYFELTSRPIKNRNHISCKGQILCIVGPGHNEHGKLHRLLNSLAEDGSKFYVAHRPLPGPINSQAKIHPATKFFRVQVELRVRDLDSPIPISLRIGNNKESMSEGQNISASPFTINGLLEAQGWNNPFGRADHGPTEPKDLARLVPECKRISKVTKRRLHGQNHSTSKRRRS